ncbi:unnamed protein product [Rotaria socialis]
MKMPMLNLLEKLRDIVTDSCVFNIKRLIIDYLKNIKMSAEDENQLDLIESCLIPILQHTMIESSRKILDHTRFYFRYFVASKRNK